jgi:hypothetical protein
VEQLSYERLPPIGNALIDDDAGEVLIRIFPDRAAGRVVSIVAGCIGIAWLAVVLSQMSWTMVSMLRAVPPLVAGVLFLVLAAAMRYRVRGVFTTIHATPTGVEITTSGFSPRLIEREKIRRVFTRDTPMSKRLTLALRLSDGSGVVIGAGEGTEIDAMAKALHRVLNTSRNG